MSYSYVDNAIVPTSGAYISASDLSLHRGYGIVEYMRTYGGKPFHLEDHLDRFFASAEAVYLEVPLTREKIRSIISEILYLSQHPETVIKLFLTGGVSPDGFTSIQPNFLVHTEAHAGRSLPPEVTLETLPYQRPIPHAKTIDYLPGIVALRESDADDILYTSSTHLFECTRANFFAIKNGTLITPKEGVLHGITRKVILSLSHLPVEERPIELEEIETFEEAFITASSIGLVPVAQIDQIELPSLRPHVETLQSAFYSYTIQSPLTEPQKKCMSSG